MFTFLVARVYRGEMSERQEIVTFESGASCGLEVEPGRDYLVFATRDGGARGLQIGSGQLHANLCGGTRPAPADPPVGLGAPRAPTATSPPAAGEASDGVSPAVAIAGGSMVLGLAALGFLLLARRRRSSSTAGPRAGTPSPGNG